MTPEARATMRAIVGAVASIPDGHPVDGLSLEKTIVFRVRCAVPDHNVDADVLDFAIALIRAARGNR